MSLKDELKRLRAEIKLHEEYKRTASQNAANVRGQILQMARYEYSEPDLYMLDVHSCDNPFKTCLYVRGEFCIVCGEPYEQK